MDISTITINPNQSFGAKINKHTKAMKYVYSYLEKYKYATEPYGGTRKELALLNKVNKALKQHPSEEIINISTIHKTGYTLDERGYISTSRAAFKDIEPCKKDSVSAELGIIRKILAPENKNMFNALMGKEYAQIYPRWWKQHISPIWDSINMFFRDRSQPFPHMKDAELNVYFRRQIDLYDVV